MRDRTSGEELNPTNPRTLARTRSVVKFLFIGPGYPGVPKAGHGTGIGTYLYELTQGLTEKGHECHIIVWGSVIREPRELEGPHMVNGVNCYVLGRTYWSVIERIFPDSRDAYNLVREARKLDMMHDFDWIEVENEEGLDIGLQRRFGDRLVLRVHTTALQMAETKNVSRRWAHRYRLQRERRSFRMARRTMTHLASHADELMRLYPELQRPVVVSHGVRIGEGADGNSGDDALPDGHAGAGQASPGTRILVVGTPDPRKGFDRIRPAAAEYAARCGPCSVTIVSSINDYHRARFQLMPPYPDGVAIEWLGSLSRKEMLTAYTRHDVLFFPSRYESFGLPLIEAAALGLPIVTANVGVAPDLMTGELSRYVVDGDDASACAEALHAAARARKQIGAVLKVRYRARYTREAMVKHYLEKLEELRVGRN